MSARIRALQQRKATTVGAMRAITDTAEAEGRDLSAEEQAQFNAHRATVTSLNASIENEQALALEEAGLNASSGAAAGIDGAGRSVVNIGATGVAGTSDNSTNDPRRGFANFGDFARSIRGAQIARRNGTAMDNRLVPLAAAPGSFAGEGGGADGGILVPPGFSQNIFTLSLGEDALLPLTDDMPIDGNNMTIPKDETTPWGSNGIRAYWQSEGAAGSATKPALSALELRLKKLMALVPVSDELASDTSALAAYLPMKVAQSIRWKINEAILLGAGGGVPLGALNSGATVTVAKDSGQATGTLTALNLANMIARLPPGSFPNAVWMINNDTLPALFTLNTANGFPLYFPMGGGQGGIQASPYGTLLGRPVIVSQHANTFSSAGDVMLVDLSYYQTITKAEGIVTATSMHLYFDADAMAYRTTFRMDGMPKISAPIDPAKGTTKLSPFVKLGAR